MEIRYSLYLLIPVVSALIGWVTNAIAVKMIFRPRKEIRFLGISIIGLIPKRKSDLAQKIAETVEKELISHKDIHGIVNSPDFHQEVLDVIMKKIDDFINDNFGLLPMLSLFLDGEAMTGIKMKIRAELGIMLPDAIENLFGKLESQLDFKKIIKEKIDGFDLTRLESIIYGIAARELKAIEIFGGVLGFFVGLVQLGILAAGKLY